jgi:hypothetical protein
MSARVLLALSVVSFVCAPAFAAPNVEGVWRGELGPLHLVLTVSRSATGGQQGLLDSVDQHTKLPIDSISTSNDKLKFEINAIGGVWEGKVDADGKHLRGSWTQGGVPKQPLDFVRHEGGPLPPPSANDGAPPKPGMFGPNVEVTVSTQPIVAYAHGQRWLAYELHVTNFGSAELTLVSVEARDDKGDAAWHSEGTDLVQRTKVVGHLGENDPTPPRIAPGARVIVQVWSVLTNATPKRLTHRLEIKEADGVTRPVTCAVTEVGDGKLRIGPPLKGAGWMAANGPGDRSGHRRALIPVAGHAWIAQRYAIDWVRVDGEGKTFSGDQKSNASYRAYGAEAIAVAPGTVVEVKDGIPENVPGDRAVPIDLETVTGNHVVIDLGNNRRALYAHFQPGSLKVKKGDRVKRGQVLGLVGNSGNSTQPHLHFHVATGPGLLDAEGVPYQYESFTAKKDPKSAPEKRKNEIPLQNEIVDFP